ncbi:Inositol 2-dehydrogenase/D-chiro-inositol 3-dehydrogenase [Paenibacillus allorhizoplanae]|uniref:Inositol 2-dehydrogenase/D-chiro-inositol 3-dehydrogenase n=1 Tax=Paenibacillus allorhizoplanae TaxID=2905648 RepID=A0ABN8GLF3_9BACL|nr:Gfo/Idh/MocA family oxidoreductase [Paenibacillus allorhizoplanae]CAH1208407.1 Inositol 2-dehydrogenase/D-chiro-inositol 3-dehydrogenase [Paenibacillus allorhizoplanae]
MKLSGLLLLLIGSKKDSHKKLGEILNIGLIGFGKWGPNIAKEVSVHNSLQLAAICDVNNHRLQVAEDLYAKSNDVFFTTDYQELLCDQIDAIVVSVGVEDSFGIATNVLLANKHLFIEKPFTLTSEHAVKLQNIAVQRGLTIHIDHLMIYHSAIIKIKSILAESNPIITFEATRVTTGQCKGPVELLWDLAVHDLAVLDCLLNGQELELLHVKYLADEVVVTLGSNSFIGNIKVGYNKAGKERHTKISSSDKEIYFDELDERKLFTIHDKNMNGFLSNPVYVTYDGPSALTTSLSHFLNCIHHHRKSMSGPEQAIRGIQIIEKAAKLLKMEMAKE